MPIFNPPDEFNFSTSKASTATATTVVSAATNTTLLLANSARLGATIFNNSTATLLIEYGTPASLTAFSLKLKPQAMLEVPFGYTGQISGLWESANGNALIREFT